MYKVDTLCPEGFSLKKIKGIIQGNILSPILCNIYLDKLDNFIKTEIKNKLEKGAKPFINPEYIKNIGFKQEEIRLPLHIQNTIKTSRRRQLEKRGLKQIIENEEFVRIKYIRYADTIIVGVRGSLELAKKIKTLIANFLKGTLHLILNNETTKITNTYSDRVQFLGMFIYNKHARDLPYKNVRAVENTKRVARRNIVNKARVTNKISKDTRHKIILALNSEKHRESILELGRVVTGKVEGVRATFRAIEQSLNIGLVGKKMLLTEVLKPTPKQIFINKVEIIHNIYATLQKYGAISNDPFKCHGKFPISIQKMIGDTSIIYSPPIISLEKNEIDKLILKNKGKKVNRLDSVKN